MDRGFGGNLGINMTPHEYDTGAAALARMQPVLGSSGTR